MYPAKLHPTPLVRGGWRAAGLVGACVVAGAWPGSARADTPQARWWVEARPWTCSAQTGPLARQIQLACDATAACAIAPNEAAASRRAILRCGEGEWTLEAQDVAGRSLWSVALGAGDEEARLRTAAVWTARSLGSDLLPVLEPATPARSIAVGVPALPRDEADVPAKETRAAHDPGAPRVSFAAMGHASRPSANSTDYGEAGGARVFATIQLPRVFGPVHFGVAASGEHDWNGNSDYTLGRAGGIVGIGAPFSGRYVVGLSGEAGAVLLNGLARDGYFSPNYGNMYRSNNVGEYVQASAHVQAPLVGAVRPFLSVSYSKLLGFTGTFPDQLIGLDIGLVWDPLR